MFTGERAIVKPGSDLYETSLNRYKFCRRFVSGKDIVLDISSGHGYGSYYLSKYARRVIGVDVNKNVIRQNRKKYSQNNLTFKTISSRKASPDLFKKFDVIVSLETIEHTKNGILFISRLKKYLKKNGTIIISTPNNYQKVHPPKNKHHHYEYQLEELFRKIKKVFPASSILVYGQGQTPHINTVPIPKTPFFQQIINLIISHIYDFDLKHFHFLEHLSHLWLYKKIGRLQQNLTDIIYPINLKEYLHPITSIFIIRI